MLADLIVAGLALAGVLLVPSGVAWLIVRLHGAARREAGSARAPAANLPPR